MILLTGATGMIGRNVKELSCKPMLTPTHDELDLTDAQRVREYLQANKPDKIIHCASNDSDLCLNDNLLMFNNLAESGIPMIIFCTGREVEDRSYKNAEYVLSKHTTKELALHKYRHIAVIQIWGCFGMYERDIRFLAGNILNIKNNKPIVVHEDRLFSYVYVKDLVRIINLTQPKRQLIRVVGYTEAFSDYATVLQGISGTKSEIIVESTNYHHSYTGVNDALYKFTPIEEAIKEYWEAVK